MVFDLFGVILGIVLYLIISGPSNPVTNPGLALPLALYVYVGTPFIALNAFWKYISGKYDEEN